jgi:hypothetical protein
MYRAMQNSGFKTNNNDPIYRYDLPSYYLCVIYLSTVTLAGLIPDEVTDFSFNLSAALWPWSLRNEYQKQKNNAFVCKARPVLETDLTAICEPIV